MTTKIEQLWESTREHILFYCERFPRPFEAALAREGLTREDLKGELKSEAIGSFCQTMWEALPDSSRIHQFGFDQLCNIAQEFCFGDEGDDDSTL